MEADGLTNTEAWRQRGTQAGRHAHNHRHSDTQCH